MDSASTFGRGRANGPVSSPAQGLLSDALSPTFQLERFLPVIQSCKARAFKKLRAPTSDKNDARTSKALTRLTLELWT